MGQYTEILTQSVTVKVCFRNSERKWTFMAVTDYGLVFLNVIFVLVEVTRWLGERILTERLT